MRPSRTDERVQGWPTRTGEGTTPLSAPGGTLRLLYVGRVPPLVDGTAIVGGQLLVGLQRRGHRTHALVPTTASVVDAPDRRALADVGVDIVPYPVPAFPTNLPGGAMDPAYRRLEHDQIQRRLPLLVERVQPHVILSGIESIGAHVLDVAGEHRVPSVQIASATG